MTEFREYWLKNRTKYGQKGPIFALGEKNHDFQYKKQKET